MAGIFICYRREDSSASAGRLYDRLAEVFGSEQVFMDVNYIEPGEDFVQSIEAQVESCHAMLVVIGKAWLKGTDGSNVCRLQDPQDYVRMELVAALRRNIRVIPVLVSGARMPGPDDLPDEVDQLARRQALELNDASFRKDVVALISVLENSLAGSLKVGAGQSPTKDRRIIDRPVNLGFDGAIEGEFPHGWFNSVGFVSNVSPNYSVRVIQRENGVGRCLMIEKQRAEPDEFGSVMQRFPAEFLAGHTVRLEGDMRTEHVKHWAGLWLRADGKKRPDLFFDNMNGQTLSGTTKWNRYTIEGRLPVSTAWLNLGVVLSGSGIVWVDNLRLTVWNNNHNSWIDV